MFDINKTDLKSLLLIRHFELLLLDLFSNGKLIGTTHTCLGQEYIPVALDSLITFQDYIFSNHRGHGHYLSYFKDAESLLAEIMGKQGAVCNGIGGSQHIKRDRFMSTGIQGEGVAIAGGVGVYLKKHEKENIAMAYIGDGTWGQGILYEILNISSLLKLPLIVIVENNSIAQSTPIELNMAGNIRERVKAFHIDYIEIDGFDIPKIRSTLKSPFKKCRKERSPLVVEFKTIRLGPHSRGDDTRDKVQISKLKEKDWYEELKNQDKSLFQEIEKDVKDYLQQLHEEIEKRSPSLFITSNEA